MAKTLHLNVADRIGDALFMALLRAGVKIGTMSLLTVRGRKSGQPHTVPVLLVEQDGQRWLVAPYGVVQWVRNIRAAGTATLTRGRRSEAISVTELPAQEAAPILKQYLLKATAARPYFDVAKDAPLEAFEREAPRHPVFKITTVEEPSRRNSSPMIEAPDEDTKGNKPQPNKERTTQITSTSVFRLNLRITASIW